MIQKPIPLHCEKKTCGAIIFEGKFCEAHEPIRSGEWIDALAEKWIRRANGERADAMRWRPGIAGDIHAMRAELIDELRSEMVSASNSPVSRRLNYD
jgi:hypothetical protein